MEAIPTQAELLQMAEQPTEQRAMTAPGVVKVKPINRAQMTMAVVNVEELVAADHKVRAIWELAGRLDLRRFQEGKRSVEGAAGRACWDPQLLVSIWVYAYSEGIGAAREIERLMEWEPGLQWLTGLEVVNHHTLSDFRVDYKEALDDLFVQMLGLLEAEGLLSLERVMHDGTKVRAQAGGDSFRREKTVREHLARARAVVEQMGDPRQEGEPRSRREAARERAARERAARLEQALEQLQQLQEGQKTEAEKEQRRVSVTEPEARVMKHGDGGYGPSYNVQISTDAAQKVIVGVGVSQSASDYPELRGAMAKVEQNLGKVPQQMVVDGGFVSRDNIVASAEKNIELVGPAEEPSGRSAAALQVAGIAPEFGPAAFAWEAATNTLRCPAGQVLVFIRQSWKHGIQYYQYQVQGGVCRDCAFQPQCCPRKPQQGRTVSRRQEPAEVAAFRQKMQTSEAKQIYRQRGAVAEFPHAWIKDKLGLRKFRVRGLVKAGLEALWACLTYNVMQWIRLRWRRPAAAAV